MRKKKRTYTYSQVVKLRKIYYKQMLSEFLVKYKHVVIILATFFPFLTVDMLAAPVLDVVLTTHSYNIELFYLVFMQLAALIWVLVQGDAVTGKPYVQYFKSLPIKKSILYIIDIRILITANLLFWVVFMLALAAAPYEQLKVFEIIVFFIRLLIMGMLILVLQVQWINKVYYFPVILLIIDLLFIYSSSMNDIYTMIISVVFLYTLTFILKPITEYKLFEFNLSNKVL